MVSNHQGYRAFHRSDPQSNMNARKRTKNGSLEMVEATVQFQCGRMSQREDMQTGVQQMIWTSLQEIRLRRDRMIAGVNMGPIAHVPESPCSVTKRSHCNKETRGPQQEKSLRSNRDTAESKIN